MKPVNRELILGITASMRPVAWESDGFVTHEENKACQWVQNGYGVHPLYAQAEIAKRDARIAELESILNEACTEREKEQAAEIARLKAVIGKCKETISGMQEWFEAEDNHAGTTFYERMDMCQNVQIKTVEALSAIKGEEGL